MKQRTSGTIPSRGFVLRGLSGLIWRILDLVAPNLALRYFARALRARVRGARRKPRTESGPIALVGGFELNIGIARAAQILRDGLEAAGIPVYPMDCSAVLRPAADRPPRPAALATGTMIFCVNPPQMVPLLSHFGPRICRGKRLVGYWWWELDRMPRAWLDWAALMDEIWVSSRFIHDTFARALPGKLIRYIPLPVPEPIPSALTRVEFGLAPDIFTVLVPFDLSSHWARKNPMGAIDAFRRAFPATIAAQLVLKVSGTDQNPDRLDQLRGLTADMPNIRIVDRSLSSPDLAALIRSADVLLSLHRSEGLGLFIAEAMWLGTPVVATAWSGSMDLLDNESAMLVRFVLVQVKPDEYPFVESGARWAEPDVSHAAECLTRLAGDAGLRNRLRERARARAEQQFSLDHFRTIVACLLDRATVSRRNIG